MTGLLGLLGLLACEQQEVLPQQPRNFSLVYTNNLDGEIEPCG